MQYLQDQLDTLITRSPDAKDLRLRLANLISVYPFNEYEYIISHLLALDILTLDEYYELRDDYSKANPE